MIICSAKMTLLLSRVYERFFIQIMFYSQHSWVPSHFQRRHCWEFEITWIFADSLIRLVKFLDYFSTFNTHFESVIVYLEKNVYLAKAFHFRFKETDIEFQWLTQGYSETQGLIMVFPCPQLCLRPNVTASV